MKLSRLTTLALASILLAAGGVARAETDSEKIQRLEEQVKALIESQQRLKDQQALSEKQLADLLTELRQVKERAPTPVPPVAPTGQPAPGSAGAPEPFRFSGDVTFRYDLTDVESVQTGVIPEGAEGTFRQRVRLNVKAPLAHRWDAALQITTGLSPSPTSPFVALGDAFRGKEIRLGRGYVTYHFGDRADPNEPILLAGKMDNPVWRAEVGAWASEIVWDNDVGPEGAAVRVPLSRKGARVGITDTLGGYLINFVPDRTLAGLTTNTYSLVNQLKVDAGQFKGAIGYLFYDHLNSGLHAPLFDPNFGIDPNPPTDAFLLRPGPQTTNNRYSYGPNANGFGSDQFHILNLTGQFLPRIKGGKLQPFLVGEYLHNFSVDVDRNGYGVTAGVTKGGAAKGSYTAWLTYRDVDADATLGTFADSDLGAGTDYRGFQVGLSYRFQPTLLGRFAYHDFKGSPAKTNAIRRVFLDLIRPF